MTDTRTTIHWKIHAWLCGEARASGIEPVCITIDKQADPYLRRMYGDVRYVVIDRVEGCRRRFTILTGFTIG